MTFDEVKLAIQGGISISNLNRRFSTNPRQLTAHLRRMLKEDRIEFKGEIVSLKRSSHAKQVD